MVERDNKIDDWIKEALLKNNNRLGRNRIYNYVDQKYRENRNKTEKLSKDVFDKHIKFLLQNGIIEKNDNGQRGTTIEHYLTPDAIRRINSGTLDLAAIKNQNKKVMEVTKLDALYFSILIYNHTTTFELKNEDEVISFLTPLHFKISKADISEWRTIDENDSEVAEKERSHFQSKIQSQDKSVTLFIHDYVSRYRGSTTSIFSCQIRGMSKNSVILNRIDKPFQHISFSPNQLDEAFDFLCKDEILHPVPNSEIYTIIDENLYFLLFFLEDLFTENVMPTMRKIWKYLRRPTSEERDWLVMLKGEVAKNRIIIEDTQHRLELENEIRRKASGIETIANKTLKEKKSEKRKEIEDQLKFLQEGFNNEMNAYKFIIDKHKILQHIFEIMFPKFLRRLELD